MAAMWRHLVVLASFVGQFLVSLGEEFPYDEINQRGIEYTLPVLGFSVGELEPFIDEATIRAHHGGHHFAYTNKMNAALDKWRKEAPGDELAKASILEILQNLDRVPRKYRNDIRNNGGGYINHCFYWAGMSGNLDGNERYPVGQIAEDINRDFGSFDKLKDAFTKMAQTLFGSGYVWLARDASGRLILTTTVDQDSPVSMGLRPVMVLDVWEHAYYLQHQYRRANYINQWWHVVDWDRVDMLDEWWDDPQNFHPSLGIKKEEL